MTREARNLHTIRQFYPNAIHAEDSVLALLKVIEQRIGVRPSQIMRADSICSDDLNSIEYPESAYEMLGPFSMGGLNGMGAFAHHVPADGAVFIFHAPHIGVTPDGNVGEIFRPGQTEPSSCCGAARGALAKLQRGEIVEVTTSELDYQQNTLEQILSRHRDRILHAPSPILAATDVFYEAIAERIDLLASRTQYPCRHLVVMGAVLINSTAEFGSYCEPRRLVHIELQSGAHTDLLADLQRAL